MEKLKGFSMAVLVFVGILFSSTSFGYGYFGYSSGWSVAPVTPISTGYGYGYGYGFGYGYGYNYGWVNNGCSLGTHGMSCMNMVYRPFPTCPRIYKGRRCYIRGFSCFCRRRFRSFSMYLGIGGWFNLGINVF